MKDQKISPIKKAFIVFFLYKVLKPLVKLLWIKKVNGKKNIPEGGAYIVAANHQSYFDFLTMSCVWPRKPTFLAAEKFYSSSLWRPIMLATEQIKVERDAEDKSEVINKSLEVLSKGNVLALFPQGTRSRTGEIGKVFTGVARFAITAKVPVVPVGIIGAYEVMPPHSNKPKIKKIIELNIGKAIYLEDYYGKELNEKNLREATDIVMKEIAKLSNKNY